MSDSYWRRKRYMEAAAEVASYVDKLETTGDLDFDNKLAWGALERYRDAKHDFLSTPDP